MLVKKILSILLTLLFSILFVACNDYKDTNLSDSKDAVIFKQEATIVKMSAPLKSKTTDEIAFVSEIIAILGEIEKSPVANEKINGGWKIMIKLNIDNQELVYTIGNIFTDSDGKQYNVKNFEEIEEKILAIYDKIETSEYDYP